MSRDCGKSSKRSIQRSSPRNFVESAGQFLQWNGLKLANFMSLRPLRLRKIYARSRNNWIALANRSTGGDDLHSAHQHPGHWLAAGGSDVLHWVPLHVLS